MFPLLFKLISAPLLLATTSLVARRWGTSVGGALAAVPIISGSIAFFVALEHNPAFGSRTAAATLVGICSLAWYSLAYAHASRRFGWPVCLVVAYLVVAAASLAVVPLANVPGFLVFGVALITLAVASKLMPNVQQAPHAAPPSWDIPARIVVGTALVVVLTALAQSLGPQLSGLLAAFPMMFSVLLVFTHRHEGPERARGLLRGFVAGLVATSLFMEVLADGLVPFGVAPTFVLAIGAFLAYQTAAIRWISRPAASPASTAASLAPADGGTSRPRATESP
jgi:hypothetical protein